MFCGKMDAVMKKRAIVLLAEGFEEIEAITAIDILRRAGADVTVAGVSGIKITGSHGITVLADKRIEEAGIDFDACVLPGGMPGSTHLAASEKVTNLIQTLHSQGKIIAAICAAPSVVLAPLGILKGISATGFPGTEKNFCADTTIKKDAVVVDANIITGRGPATALLFALAIVEKLIDTPTAEKLGPSLAWNGEGLSRRDGPSCTTK
jgi:4-methyl-5(b-hydroxyethyl)-thiazole monophosphate biosynthesis